MSTSVLPMHSVENSIARDRNRRTSSNSLYARNPNVSGQQNPGPLADPRQPELAGNSLGQPFDSSSTLGNINNSGSGSPRPPPIPQNPQHDGETSDGSLPAHIDSSARQPELPRCSTSGASSGVTSVGFLGCSTSTGNPSQNHSRVDSSISLSSPTSSTNFDMNSYRKQYSASDPDYLPALQPLDKSLRQRFTEQSRVKRLETPCRRSWRC